MPQMRPFNFEEKMCKICHFQIEDDAKFVTKDCCNLDWHRDCVKGAVTHSIRQRKFPVSCPSYRCRKELKEEVIVSIIADEPNLV